MSGANVVFVKQVLYQQLQLEAVIDLVGNTGIDQAVARQFVGIAGVFVAVTGQANTGIDSPLLPLAVNIDVHLAIGAAAQLLA